MAEVFPTGDYGLPCVAADPNRGRAAASGSG